MKLALFGCYLLVAIGCGGGTFSHIGNGVCVPAASIKEYATLHGVTREQAIEEMRLAAQQKRIAEHAEKYGISLEEAETQLEVTAGSQD